MQEKDITPPSPQSDTVGYNIQEEWNSKISNELITV